MNPFCAVRRLTRQSYQGKVVAVVPERPRGAAPGGPADPATKGAKLAKPPTEGQAKALIFGSRMTVADEILNDLDGKYSIGGVNALNGLNDTVRGLGVREVVEAMDMDQMTNPNVRSAILTMRKEVRKIPGIRYSKYTQYPPSGYPRHAGAARHLN